MAEFNRGQTFLDRKSSNFDGTKGKYFIALSNAEYTDDYIICFVMNTEHNMNNLHYNCNKNEGKFIIKPDTFSFISNNTSIMLKQPVCYTLDEMYKDNIKLFNEIADEELQRQIKNCLDFGYIPIKFAHYIKESFK